MNYNKIEENILRLINTNPLCIVLKNDAYGFGLKKVLSLGIKNKVKWFAVNSITEAIDVRLISDAKVLLFGKYFGNIELLKQYKIIPTASTIEEINLYTNNKISFAIKLDTGMNRYGFKDFDEEILTSSYVVMLYTHLYHKSMDNIKIVERLKSMCRRYNKLLQIGGSLAYGQTDEMLRVGKILYKDALSLYGRVSIIKKVLKNESVGYDGIYIASKECRVAIIDIGYYNGLPVIYNGEVYCKGRRYAVIGRVCMNHCFILVDDQVCEQDLVEFFGENISMEEFMANSNKTEYECFLSIR